MGDEITEEMIDEGVKHRLEIADGKTYPMLGDIRATKMFTREARNRLVENDAESGVAAVAILISNKTHEVFFNFL